MANKEHLKVLKQGVAVWNRWRKENHKETPDLSGADLCRTDLRGANLSNTELSWANLRKADLGFVNLRNADLTDADLRAAILHRANLRQASLDRAQLIGAHLHQADLVGAYFPSADLRGAHLNSADLHFTDLTGADLSGAALDGANFNSSKLDGANFNHATVGFTTFLNIDLRGTRGMDTINHRAPSNIGIETIYLSKGKISAQFLSGAGVPEVFITNMQSLVAAMAPLQFYSCFISYSHIDKRFAHKLHDELQKRGIRCWLDEHQLRPGDDMYIEVDRGIRLWDKVLLCCSQSSLKSWWVDNEIGTALEKEQQLTNERGEKVQVLIPLNLDGYLFSKEWSNGYQAQLRRRLAPDFMGIKKNASKFMKQVEKLILALRADEGAREAPPRSKL